VDSAVDAVGSAVAAVGSGVAGVGSSVGCNVGQLLGFVDGCKDGSWLGLSLDSIMVGVLVRLLLLGWMVGMLVKGDSVVLLCKMALGTEIALELTLAPCTSSSQTQQYGPPLTDVGDKADVIGHLVPTKANAVLTDAGNLLRHGQRSWLKEDAPVNM
jgi:hypothetical protein